jgi:hypothetical protein
MSAELLASWLSGLGLPGPGATAAILSVYLLAGAVKGALGFGLPVVAVTLLPLFVPMQQALALNALVILGANLQQIAQAGEPRAGLAAAWPMLAGLAVAVPPGALLAARVPPETLTLVLGLFVLAFVLWSLVRPGFSIPPARRRSAGLAFGLASGAVGAITSSPGPIFVSYVVALGVPRAVHMAALGVTMIVFAALLAGSYAAVGILRAEHLVLGALCLLPAAAGMALGNAAGLRLGAERFRAIVLAALGVIALELIRRSVL